MKKNRPLNIGEFNLYQKEENTISKKGSLYVTDVYFETKNQFKNRQLSVYLPSTYDFSNPRKRFPVLYMFDGSNLFDDYQSFAGEWNADEHVENLIKDGEINGLIVVGLDSPGDGKDRECEMLPLDLPLGKISKEFNNREQYGNILIDFIVKEVKPLIDKRFFTLRSKKSTGIGGSSMGGLMSFYSIYKYNKTFSFCLSFSPAFECYRRKPFLKWVTRNYKNLCESSIIYMFNGDQELDTILKPLALETYETLNKIGFNKDNLAMLFDSRCKHHESEWSKYFEDAIRFWFKK